MYKNRKCLLQIKLSVALLYLIFSCISISAFGSEKGNYEKSDSLTHLNLDHFFTNKIFGDQVEETKPSPEIYETIVSMAGFDKEDSIVLEDSLTGLKAAVGAGLKVIWIPTEESRSEKLDEGMEITAQVDHLRDALEIIKKIS